MRTHENTHYPQKANWVVDEGVEENRHVLYVALTGDTYYLDAESYEFLVSLDGQTDPFGLGYPAEEARRMIRVFLDCLLVRFSRRVFFLGRFEFLVTLWIPRKERVSRRIPRIYNMILLILWGPFFAAGIWMIHRFGAGYRVWTPWMSGLLVGTALGALLHELSHVFAGLAYGGEVLEGGLFWRFMIPGGYVLTDDRNVKEKWKRLQIHGAGVEMNFLIAGGILILRTLLGRGAEDFLMGISMANLVLGIYNVIPFQGLDGWSILEEVRSVK